MTAPYFSLPDQDNTLHTSTQYLGQWVILYFYPKDDTPGCTAEACSFRDEYELLTKKGAVILGVSTDSVKSHAKFAKKYQLPFPLLSDCEHQVIEAYNAYGPKKFMGRSFMGTQRKTVLISPEGEIIQEYPQVTPTTHAAELSKEIDRLILERQKV